MNNKRRWMGIALLGLLSIGFTLSATAAGYLHCPDPLKPDHCYPIHLEETRFPIDPDPGPYRAVDLSSIVVEIQRALGVSGEANPEPWMMFDMENKEMVVLDFEKARAFVPEPGMLAGLMIGLGGLAAMARRRSD